MDTTDEAAIAPKPSDYAEQPKTGTTTAHPTTQTVTSNMILSIKFLNIAAWYFCWPNMATGI